MAELKLVVFDCDGTLVDSQYMITAAMAEAFTAHGLAAPEVAAVRRVVGLALDEAVARLMPEADMGLVAAVAERYKRAFRRLREDGGNEPLYPGARAAVETLAERGYLLGVATGKSRRGLKAVLALHDLDHFFLTLQTADDAPGKPHPAMLRQAMAAVGAETTATVMVGDTSYDMLMADAAGTQGLGVGWGYHDPSELMEHGAARVIGDFAELVPTVDQLFARVAEDATE